MTEREQIQDAIRRYGSPHSYVEDAGGTKLSWPTYSLRVKMTFAETGCYLRSQLLEMAKAKKLRVWSEAGVTHFSTENRSGYFAVREELLSPEYRASYIASRKELALDKIADIVQVIDEKSVVFWATEQAFIDLDEHTGALR